MKIDDMLGREILILVDEFNPAGFHQVDWKGEDQAGRPAASGLYIYQIETEIGTISRKMLLIR